MAKIGASFRIEEGLFHWLETAAEQLGTSRTGLLEDALRHANVTYQAAYANHGAMLHELARRYGEGAQLLTYVVQEDGNARARILIDGQEPADVRGDVSISPSGKLAHIFLQVADLEEERHGTYHLGSAVAATSPRLSVVDLPYPPDPIQPAAAIATIGDLIHGGARARELAEL